MKYFNIDNTRDIQHTHTTFFDANKLFYAFLCIYIFDKMNFKPFMQMFFRHLSPIVIRINIKFLFYILFRTDNISHSYMLNFEIIFIFKFDFHVVTNKFNSNLRKFKFIFSGARNLATKL